MSHHPNPLDELISTLKQQRDEIALKIHLAAAEAKDEWKRTSEKYDTLVRDYEPVRKAVSDSATDVTQSLKLVAEEVQKSFNRIRKSF